MNTVIQKLKSIQNKAFVSVLLVLLKAVNEEGIFVVSAIQNGLNCFKIVLL